MAGAEKDPTVMAGTVSKPPSFYVAGGNLMPDARSYVVRPADSELFESIRDGHYSYVLTSRQMGKSSLMHRTAVRLEENGITSVLLDLTAIGANLSAEQWYFGLLAELGKQLYMTRELEQYWNENQQHGPLYRFIHSISDVILTRLETSLAIFIDEIDFIRGLKNFSTDEFFAGIRQCFNSRASLPEMHRLTFCLLGVATPADLIRDVHTTPFNIGRQIELTDFTFEEALQLTVALDPDPAMAERKLKRILDWTGGHPYLTQKLCLYISDEPSIDLVEIDRICHRMFLSSGVRRSEDNLIFVHNTLRNGLEDSATVIATYRKILAGNNVQNDPADPVIALLKLSGIVRVDDGRLEIRNRIYRLVFDRRWVEENMPDADLRRERAAYRAGIVRSAAVFSIILAIVGILFSEAIIQGNRARIHEIREGDTLYVADMNLAQQDLNSDGIKSTLYLLNQHGDDPRRSFDWAYLWTSCYSNVYATLSTGHRVAYSVDFSSTRGLLTAGSDDGQVTLWSGPAYRSTRTLSEAKQAAISVVFLPDGRRVAVLRDDGTVGIWNAISGLCLVQWKINSAYLTDLAISKDGSQIAVSGDFGVELFDLAGHVTARYRPPPESPLGSLVSCSSVAFAPNGRWLIAGCLDSTARIWSITERRELRRVRHSDAIEAVAVSPDGNLVATASDDRSACLWDSATGGLVTTLVHKNLVTALDFSHSGQWLATGSEDNAVRIWSTENFKCYQVLEGHTGVVRSVRFGPGDRLIGSASADDSVIVWRFDPSQYPYMLHGKAPNPPTYIFSPDGRWIADVDTDGVLRVWDTGTAREVHEFQFLPGSVGRVSFTSTGDALMVGRVGRPLALYSTVTWLPITDCSPALLPIASPLAISEDSTLLAADGPNGAQIWDLQKRRVRFTLKSGALVLAAAFSPDGTALATVSEGNVISVWNSANGAKVVDIDASATWVRSIVFVPDGKEIVAGTDDGSICFWDLKTQRQTLTLNTPNLSSRSPDAFDHISSVAFAPGGTELKAITTGNYVWTWRTDAPSPNQFHAEPQSTKAL